MAKILIYLSLTAVLLFGFVHLVQENALNKAKVKESEDQLKIYAAQTKKNNKIVENLESKIAQLESVSKEREEELQNALKDNKCFNEPVPDLVADKLRKRANSLRSATANP